MSVSFEVRPFVALSARDVYELLSLRARVFVVEQRCAYLDPDGRDLDALHVIGRHEGRIVACARILAPGARFEDAHAIGRIVVAPEHRGRGIARALLREAIDAIERAHGPVPIALSAQSHLERMYASFGFVRVGDPYDEDGIAHVDMVRAGRRAGPP